MTQASTIEKQIADWMAINPRRALPLSDTFIMLANSGKHVMSVRQEWNNLFFTVTFEDLSTIEFAADTQDTEW